MFILYFERRDMNQGDCKACEKPLLGQPGPVIMDRDAHRYHFDCWRTAMDARTKKHHPAGESDPTDPA